ncbi:lamin tail domain-containing protein, partial [Candidatus Peregrinibacteria bacterium]|nr:lamin tail domain-containing protein [Candidatus Peregrinibacteria bacterium]
VDLSGWKLDDAEGGGSRAWEFPEGFLVQPGAFILLRSDQTHLALNNDGDSVALIAPNGRIIDRVAYGKFRRGRAFARVIQRIGSTGEFRATERFCITDRPTPFERNICRVMVSVDEPSRRQGGVSPFGYAPAVAKHTSPRLRGPGAMAGKQGDTSNRSVPSKVRRVVRLARRVRYHNILPPDVASGSVVAADPLFAALLERMGRSVQSGQVVWGEKEVAPGMEKTTEWEFLVLPLLAIVGCHGMLRSSMEWKRQSLSTVR